MSKMFFNDPSIFRGPINPNPTDPIGGGSAQSGVDPTPVSGTYWLEHNYVDYNGNGVINFDDYVAWWGAMMQQYPSVFTTARYQQLNGTPYPTQNP